MGATLTVLLVVLVAVVMFILGKASYRQQPEKPKRFGLAEAEAALTYVGNAGPGATRAVLGVVVGVLGFENAVSADAEEEVADLNAANQRREQKIADNQDDIAALRAKIATLEAAIVSDDRRAEAVRKVVEAFSA